MKITVRQGARGQESPVLGHQDLQSSAFRVELKLVLSVDFRGLF